MTKPDANCDPVTQPIDFDEWAQLAKTDREAFEARRRAVIEETINQVPEDRRQRLRGLQFRIDMERRRARTPLGACIRLSSMMWDFLLGPDGLQQRLQELFETIRKIDAGETASTIQALPKTAEIVDLSSRRPR